MPETATIADPRRHVQLEGTYNVRDLGGYLTTDGRRVRWGRVYRGGSVHSATPADVRLLTGLGIRAICDLRSGPERVAADNHWAVGAGIETWGYAEDNAVGDSRQLLGGAFVSPEQTRALMARTYARIPFDQAQSYVATFSRIAAGKLPLLFHCSAGKDRSGVASALLLAVLGVRSEEIVADYLLSSAACERMEDVFIADPRHQRARDDQSRAWAPLLETNPAYLEAMLASVERRRGSITAYFDADLGIGATGVAALRRELLE